MSRPVLRHRDVRTLAVSGVIHRLAVQVRRCVLMSALRTRYVRRTPSSRTRRRVLTERVPFFAPLRRRVCGERTPFVGSPKIRSKGVHSVYTLGVFSRLTVKTLWDPAKRFPAPGSDGEFSRTRTKRVSVVLTPFDLMSANWTRPVVSRVGMMPTRARDLVMTHARHTPSST